MTICSEYLLKEMNIFHSEYLLQNQSFAEYLRHIPTTAERYGLA